MCGRIELIPIINVGSQRADRLRNQFISIIQDILTSQKYTFHQVLNYQARQHDRLLHALPETN